MSEWAFQRKLITGVVGICLLAILISGASILASRALIGSMERAGQGEGAELAAARALQLAGLENIAEVHACLLGGARDCATAAGAGSARLRTMATRLRARVTSLESRELIDQILAADRAHFDAFAGEMARTDASIGADEGLHSEVLSSAAQFKRALAALVTSLETAGLAGAEVGRSAVRRGELLLIGVTVGMILLLAALCVFLIVILSRSYRKQYAARSLAEADQTRARASLTEVEAASHMKDEFLATVSHELRNPLAPILTWTQLLRSGTLDEEKTRRALEVIERNVTSQAQLIDDLVDVSRVVSGKFRLDVRPVDLMPVIRAAAEAQIPASDAKQIRLQLVLDERAGQISGDSERLQQVMWNLISNAIKFTPKGGRVQVVLQRAESHVEIAVSDSGVGIDSEFLPHVFEPFRQATGGPMRRHGGLGLGLSIVRHIVELHGGEISVHSEGRHLGSRFTIKFPLLATAQESSDSPRRHPIARDMPADVHLGRLDGIRVLVVEDEPSAREALLVLFNSCGAETRTAGSAGEALAVLDVWRADVLVSDVAMPGEDGYSLIRKIRQRPRERGGAIRAVALTAYAKIEDRVAILDSGFQMYLSKPADPNELIAVVMSLAGQRGFGERRIVS